MKLEKILIAAILTGLVFKFLHWPMAGLILVISCSVLSMLYFVGGIYFMASGIPGKVRGVLPFLTGLFLSILVMGVLFKLQFWPGEQLYLLMGLVSVPVLLFAISRVRRRDDGSRQHFLNGMTRRVALWGASAAILYATPMKTLLDIQYRDDPELARLLHQSYTDPGNEEYRKQVDAYWDKKREGWEPSPDEQGE